MKTIRSCINNTFGIIVSREQSQLRPRYLAKTFAHSPMYWLALCLVLSTRLIHGHRLVHIAKAIFSYFEQLEWFMPRTKWRNQ